MLDDVVAYDAAKANPDEVIPGAVVDAILDGDNPVKVWRKHRGLSQSKLAGLCGTTQAYIAQIETRKRKGSAEVYKAIAEALNVDVDDLL